MVTPIYLNDGNLHLSLVKVRKKAKFRNRYNQVPHLTQETTWESGKAQENTTHKRAKGLAMLYCVSKYITYIDVKLSSVVSHLVYTYCQSTSLHSSFQLAKGAGKQTPFA